jgi:hypothetical protein
MGLAASDGVFVPIMMSLQSGVRTLDTLQAILHAEKVIGGLVPTLVGSARWQEARVESWRAALMDTVLPEGRGVEVLPAMPFSHSLPPGRWRWGKLPRECLAVLDALYARLLREQALTAAEVEGPDVVEPAVVAVEGVDAWARG